MRKTRTGAVVIAVAVLLLSAATSCVCVGERLALVDLRTESHSVALEGAEKVVVRLDIGMGDFKVHGGSEDLLDAEFSYNVAEWKPVIDYRVDGSTGYLTITQPDKVSGSAPDRARNEWDLSFGGDVPMVLDVDMGVGKAHLELGGLKVTDLMVDHGVGDLTVDLSGEWSDDLNASIDGGVGRVVVTVPSSPGVRLDTDMGIGSVNTTGLSKRGGSLVNDAYGHTDVTLDVSIDAGIGRLEVQVSDSGTVSA